MKAKLRLEIFWETHDVAYTTDDTVDTTIEYNWTLGIGKVLEKGNSKQIEQILL